MKRMILAALFLSPASASFADNESLINSYRSALEYTRTEAARQKAEAGFAAEMRRAGLTFTDPRDHSERNPVVADFGVILSKDGRYGAVAFVASRMEDNPLVWMAEVNGFLVDLRHAPREVQEIAYEQGLIPYIPADQGSE